MWWLVWKLLNFHTPQYAGCCGQVLLLYLCPCHTVDSVAHTAQALVPELCPGSSHLYPSDSFESYIHTGWFWCYMSVSRCEVYNTRHSPCPGNSHLYPSDSFESDIHTCCDLVLMICLCHAVKSITLTVTAQPMYLNCVPGTAVVYEILVIP